MVTCHIPVLFVWYDINCRFSAYFRQWACKHPMLASLLVYVGTKFVLPIFHRHPTPHTPHTPHTHMRSYPNHPTPPPPPWAFPCST